MTVKGSVGSRRAHERMLRHVRLWRALAFSFCLFLTWSAAPAQAQDAAPARSKRVKKPSAGSRASRRRKRSKRGRAEPTPEVTPEPASTPNVAASPTPARKERGTDTAASRAAESAAQGVDSEVVKEGDTSVKVMRFSGLDVEGRLKSPQLLYFVNRVRAEFDRPKLPHRSFMPELDRSTKRDPL